MGFVTFILDLLGLRPLSMIMDMVGWFLPFAGIGPSAQKGMQILVWVIAIGAIIGVIALVIAFLVGPLRRMCPIGSLCPMGRMSQETTGPEEYGGQIPIE